MRCLVLSDTVKISWSGGKDSTASVLLHLERGDNCKVVYYIPVRMFLILIDS